MSLMADRPQKDHSLHLEGTVRRSSKAGLVDNPELATHSRAGRILVVADTL